MYTSCNLSKVLVSFSVIKTLPYLHFAYCTTVTSPFCSLRRLLSLRENPFSNCRRPTPHKKYTDYSAGRERASDRERASRQQNAGWGPTTSTRCSTTSGLNQSSGASVWMEQREVVLLTGPGNMIKEPAAWLRCSPYEWNNREGQTLVLNSPDGGETGVCGGEESEVLPCDREKIKDWQ